MSSHAVITPPASPAAAGGRRRPPTRDADTRRPRRARDPEWIRFRSRIVDALVRDGAFFYIAKDRVAGRCPICEEVLGVRFKGRTPAADLICHAGCPESRVAAALGRALAR